MNWSIKKHESVGPIGLGESRQSVREKLGPSYDTFEKVPGANPTDAYDEIGAHFYYDDDDQLEFAEFFEPAELNFEGVDLLGRPFKVINADLGRYDPKPRRSDVGYEYDELGIALTLADDQVEGVAVYRRGYYERSA